MNTKIKDIETHHKAMNDSDRISLLMVQGYQDRLTSARRIAMHKRCEQWKREHIGTGRTESPDLFPFPRQGKRPDQLMFSAIMLFGSAFLGLLCGIAWAITRFIP